MKFSRSMPPSVLIVGCGRIAGGFSQTNDDAPVTHMAAYRAANVLVAGCCDSDLAKAGTFAKRWGVESWGDDPVVMLRKTNPSIVSICTPPSANPALIEAALSNSSVKAVLVEKPLAASASEARAIAARAGEVPLVVNYQRAFHPFYARLGELVTSGNLGRLRSVAARYYGLAQTIASHWLERAIALLGNEYTVHKLGGTVESPLFEVRFAGIPVTFIPTAGCVFSPFELDLFFEKGRVRVLDSECRAEQFRAVPDPRYANYFTLTPDAVFEKRPPDAGSLLPVVRAVAAASAGEPTNWRSLLARAVRVAEILDALK